MHARACEGACAFVYMRGYVRVCGGDCANCDGHVRPVAYIQHIDFSSCVRDGIFNHVNAHYAVFKLLAYRELHDKHLSRPGSAGLQLLISHTNNRSPG